MRFLTWIIRLALFAVLLAFAIKNTDPVTLRFYFGLEWEAPLVLALFGFFAAGALFGLFAVTAALFRQRRQIVQLRKELRQRDGAASRGERILPPAVDA